MAKFKVGDKIYFKADSYNRYRIDEVHEKDNYYVYYLDGKAHRMDMSYTDANFELQRSSKKEKELDFQEFAKEMSKILSTYTKPEHPEDEPLDYEWVIAQHFYNLGNI